MMKDADLNRSTLKVQTLEVTTIYLQMLWPPHAGQDAPPPPRDDLHILHAERPPVRFYRFLYHNVGAPWLWYERRLLGDEQLAAIVHDPKVEVHVLYAGGVPAGYAELDRRAPGQVEIAYFGLMPDFIGQRLGGHFLRWTVKQAWVPGPDRVWVHTCSLDHPRALETYVAAGFHEYNREKSSIPDPRSLLSDD